uniref:Uncharacterized protein n=1 Tax=Anguilla anguilla TaxID=7936 RepID=A0A0E9Y1Y0_ANGAN
MKEYLIFTLNVAHEFEFDYYILVI